MQAPDQNYRSARLDPEVVYQQLNEGLGLEYEPVCISAHLAALIYNRDAIVRRVVNSYGNLMAKSEWTITASDSNIAAYIRDAIDSMHLIKWLGQASARAAIFTESFLVLPADWEQFPRVCGVTDWECFHNGDRPPQDCFLLRIEAEQNLTRFLKYFYPYLELSTQLLLLGMVSESMVISSEQVQEDLKRIPLEQQEQYLSNLIESFRDGVYNRGISLVSKDTKVELLHRKLDAVLDSFNVIRDNMIAASSLPHAQVMNFSREGGGLAGIDKREAQALSEEVNLRRVTYWSETANWIIDRLLLRIGAEPGSARIQWLDTPRQDPTDAAEIAERESKMYSNYINAGVITPEEVRHSKFQGSKLGFGQVNLESDVPSNNILTDALDRDEGLVQALWDEYRANTNMGVSDYLLWLRDERRLQNNVDGFWFSLTLELISADYNTFASSKKLQEHALRSLKAIARFRVAEPGLPHFTCGISPQNINLRNWGYDIYKDKGFTAPEAAKAPVHKHKAVSGQKYSRNFYSFRASTEHQDAAISDLKTFFADTINPDPQPLAGLFKPELKVQKSAYDDLSNFYQFTGEDDFIDLW